jgi:hypothetical protein
VRASQRLEEPDDGRAQPISVEADGLAGKVSQAEQLAPCLVAIPVPQQMPNTAEPVAHHVEAGVMDRLQGIDALQGLLGVAHPHGNVPRPTVVPSETAEAAPTQRGRHVQSIAEHGRAAWQKASGYTKRARAEAAISRFKQVIGDGLRSRADERRATEVDVAVHALNRMLELGRPISVRVA